MTDDKPWIQDPSARNMKMPHLMNMQTYGQIPQLMQLDTYRNVKDGDKITTGDSYSYQNTLPG